MLGAVHTIKSIFDPLSGLVGMEFADPGNTQERQRGIVVQRRAAESLGIGTYADNGQFPDLLCQVVEVKLQLAPTIDLGSSLPTAPIPCRSFARTSDIAISATRCSTRFAMLCTRRGFV